MNISIFKREKLHRGTYCTMYVNGVRKYGTDLVLRGMYFYVRHQIIDDYIIVTRFSSYISIIIFFLICRSL